MRLSRIIAVAFLGLAFACTSLAQTTVNVVLTVPVAAPCGNITTETIDGQPYDLSKWNYGTVSPDSTTCGTTDGGIGIEMPPQPYYSNYPAWVGMPIPRSDVQRGALVKEACPAGATAPCYSEVDTFNWTDPNGNEGSWSGSLTRHFEAKTRCIRFHGCNNPYQVELSDVVNMTGIVN